MSRDFSPQDLDHALGNLADLRPINREPRERDPGQGTATSRRPAQAPGRFSRERPVQRRFEGGPALPSRQGSTYVLGESAIPTISELGTLSRIAPAGRGQ